MPPSDHLALCSGTVDLARRRLTTARGEEHLTSTEVALLRYLAASPGRAVPREELLREVWGYAEGAVSRTIDVTVRRLRAKIEPDPAAPVHLLAVHGVGYTFVPAADAPALPEGRGAGDVAGPPGAPSAAVASAPAPSAPVAPVPAPTPAAAPAPAGEALIGRVDERAAAWARLRPAHPGGGARPLTITGPAGVGKTRLAQALAEEAAAEGRAAWFVDLTAAATADDLAVAAAAALGVGVARDTAITDALGRADALLVLDNFEQLPADAAARVAGWMERAPGATFVVTSRRRLGLPGEELLRLEPLPVDDAVALFCRRARRVRPDVRLDDLAGLRALVERVDGLPLAVELAAGRTRALSVAEVAARIAVPFLRDATPATPRRAALGLALDASWALLSEEARRGLAALSALPGATAVEVAERLLENVGIEDPLTVIETLVDHSLVRVGEGPPGTAAARLTPFVVVAEYAEARRAEVGVGDAPFAWAAALAGTLETWAVELGTAARTVSEARAFAESDAVLALLQRHAEVAPRDAVRAAEAWLEAAKSARGHPAEAAIVDGAVRLARAFGVPARLARLLALRVWVHDRLGRLDDACADADAVAALAAAHPELAGVRLRADLGRVSALRRSHRLTEALAAIEGLALPTDAPATVRSNVQSEIGLIRLRLGDLEAATAAFARALDLAEEAGDERRAGLALEQLAIARVEAGRGAEIEARVRAAADRRRAASGDTAVAPLWYVLGVIALEAGRLDEARAAFLAEQRANAARGNARAVPSGQVNAAYVDLRGGDAVAAAARLAEACEGFAGASAGRVPVPAIAGHALARIGAGERGVTYTLPPAARLETPVDHALHELAQAAVAFASAREAGADTAAPAARLRAALATPTAGTSTDVRELVRFVRGWLGGG